MPVAFKVAHGAEIMANRNSHTWKHKTADGDRREVRAEKFGKKWKLQSKLKHDARWTYHDVPELDDLITLRLVLFNKYQRKHLAYEDVAAVEQMITEAGGTWEEEGVTE